MTPSSHIKATLKHGLTPIVCVGESLEQTEAGETQTFLGGQVLVATTLWRTWTVGAVTATEAVIADPGEGAPTEDHEEQA